MIRDQASGSFFGEVFDVRESVVDWFEIASVQILVVIVFLSTVCCWKLLSFDIIWLCHWMSLISYVLSSRRLCAFSFAFVCLLFVFFLLLLERVIIRFDSFLRDENFWIKLLVFIIIWVTLFIRFLFSHRFSLIFYLLFLLVFLGWRSTSWSWNLRWHHNYLLWFLLILSSSHNTRVFMYHFTLISLSWFLNRRVLTYL